MKFDFNRKPNDPYSEAFREIALHHNVRSSRLLAAIIGTVSLALFLIGRFSDANQVLKYPGEYAAAITFMLVTSGICYLSFLLCRKANATMRMRLYKVVSDFYAIIIVISSLWITFVMQHNPSNTMSIFVLGILTVSALWIFDKAKTLIIAVFILILFNGGLHYFQTDSCKLFTNYITGTCVSIFFVCISRVCFKVNYNHFKQLRKIEESNQDLVRMNEMQSQILSIVAHDLRAPNNNIITLVDLLKDDSVTPGEREGYYDMILTTCTRSNDIIDDLLKVAKDEVNSDKLVTECMNDFIRNVVAGYKKLNSIPQQIVYNPPHGKLYAAISYQKMERVIENIISNAVKFTGDDGIITVTLKKDGDNVSILVADNGIGIPKDIIPFLFNRFSQAGRTGLKGEDSYGLGLSICKVIVEQHNGTISAISQEGKGSQIRILIPAMSSA